MQVAAGCLVYICTGFASGPILHFFVPQVLRAYVINGRSRGALFILRLCVSTHRNSDKVLQLELLQQTVGEILPRVRVVRHALVLLIQEDLGSGESECHGPHGVVRLLRKFRVCDASINQLRDEFRVRLRNERGLDAIEQRSGHHRSGDSRNIREFSAV